MNTQAVGFALAVVLFFIVRYLSKTDVPKIKGIPEIPGIPIFGNLLQLGDEHARRARAWVKQYGPVFQVRLGNRVSGRVHVCVLETLAELSCIEDCICQYL